MPLGLHTFRANPEDYLLFIGRISPEKRLDRAIEIARRSGRKLKVAAKIYDEDRGYYQSTIEPLLRASQSFVEFVGEVGGKDKDDLIGNAYALLFPIDWPEPFGLVMIEALACGTPVIAWRNGSVPEIIEHGKTGFIVDNIDDAVQAVANIGHLSRAACRASFDDRFDAACMASNYEKVYQRLLHRPYPQMDIAESAGPAQRGAGRLEAAMESSRYNPAPAHSGDAHHVLADSSLTDERIRVLKHGDTFALFDQYGDIRPSQNGEGGLYHDGTRFLSQFFLELEGARPFLLSSTVRDDNDQLYGGSHQSRSVPRRPRVSADGLAASGVAEVSLDGHAVPGTAHREPWNAAGRSRHRAALRRRLRRHLRGARPQKESARPGSGARSNRSAR